jgi:dihydrolipoamide dehydrogenase
MKQVPRRLLILGAGPVGVEMAQVVQRLGGQAVIIETSERVLPREPAALGEALGEALRRDGIDLVLSASVTAARREGEDFVVEFDDGRQVRGDRLLVATGRRPRVADIGLETIGVEPDPRGVAVDAQLRVTEGVWAVGDVIGIWPLTHVGKYQGRVVVRPTSWGRRVKPSAQDRDFRHDLAGRVEDGRDGVSDPMMGGLVKHGRGSDRSTSEVVG